MDKNNGSVLNRRYTALLFSIEYEKNGNKFKTHAKVEWNDSCENGHNTFSITGSRYEFDTRSQSYKFWSGGCIHEELSEQFPHLRPYI